MMIPFLIVSIIFVCGLIYFIELDVNRPYVRCTRHLVFYGLLLIQPICILVLLRLIFINDILPYINGK
jgi:hypothetical protein